MPTVAEIFETMDYGPAMDMGQAAISDRRRSSMGRSTMSAADMAADVAMPVQSAPARPCPRQIDERAGGDHDEHDDHAPAPHILVTPVYIMAASCYIA